MLVRIIPACFAMALLAAPAVAQECQNLGRAEREALIRKAPTCDTAHEQYSQCVGVTGDSALADMVTEKCEAEFLPKIVRTPRWGTYQRSIKRCDDKYDALESSMSDAMAAGCRIEVARSYAHKFSKPQPAKRQAAKHKAR
ncbi:MAG TPA: hypothetical protein VIJ78_02060 [Pseudolabrys sp.]